MLSSQKFLSTVIKNWMTSLQWHFLFSRSGSDDKQILDFFSKTVDLRNALNVYFIYRYGWNQDIFGQILYNEPHINPEVVVESLISWEMDKEKY